MSRHTDDTPPQTGRTATTQQGSGPHRYRVRHGAWVWHQGSFVVKADDATQAARLGADALSGTGPYADDAVLEEANWDCVEGLQLTGLEGPDAPAHAPPVDAGPGHGEWHIPQRESLEITQPVVLELEGSKLYPANDDGTCAWLVKGGMALVLVRAMEHGTKIEVSHDPVDAMDRTGN